MMRPLLGTLLALTLTPALAQEGGPIRTGEHPDFTRVVLTVEPRTEWALETAPGRATLFFPRRQIDFGTEGVFARIPRTRITGIASEVTPSGTRVEVDVNCDCRISASFVGARFLALDVTDRTAPVAAASSLAPPDAPPEASAEPPETPDAAIARRAREADAVASAEQVLLEQLSHAADQGLVAVDPGTALPTPTSGPDPLPEVAALPEPEPEPAPEPVPVEPPAARPQPRPALALPEPADPTSLAELALIQQIEAITVFDRDSAALRAVKPPRPVPETCVPDDRLAVGDWTNGRPLHAQTPEILGRIMGEFDRPDPRAVRDLARLYIRFGFGAEARNLLDAFDVAFEDRELLADLARTVEGRPVSTDGPLAGDVPCDGAHGLWLALGGTAPVYQDPENFATVQEAFAAMPADLRGLLAPQLVTRLLEAGHPAEARLVEVTAARPGTAPSADLRLAEAQLLAAEGYLLEATTALTVLAESSAHNALDALAVLARLAIDNNFRLPDRLLTDLRGAVQQQRGSDREPLLRGLLVETLARRGDLAAAVAEVRIARTRLPDEATTFAALGQDVLAKAEPDKVGTGTYAETVLASTDLLAASPDGDAARALIADRLIGVGLPNAALTLLAPPLSRGDGESRILAARAHLALDDAEAARIALDGLPGFEALTLRAAALARSGDPEAAMALLENAGAEAAAEPYAWTAGAWERVRETGADPERIAMAAFMATRAAPPVTPAPLDLDSLTPETAFEAPLPALDRPSLAASRSLLAAGREVTAFLGGVLEEE